MCTNGRKKEKIVSKYEIPTIINIDGYGGHVPEHLKFKKAGTISSSSSEKDFGENTNASGVIQKINETKQK